MRNIQYDSNPNNIDRMIEIQRQRINHIKTLNTIYKKKSYSLLKQQLKVDRERSLRQRNQIIDKERKWRETQQGINFENTILRNKLLQIYIPKDKESSHDSFHKNNESLDTLYQNSRFGLHFGSSTTKSRAKINSSMQNTPNNHKRADAQKEIKQKNIKFFERLSNIKSQLIPKLKLRQHSKDAQYFKQMLQKRSPKRQLRMKKLIERNISQRPKAVFPSAKSHKQIHPQLTNPQEHYVFF